MASEPSAPDPNARVSFDEFKLYFDSTEKVTDRRLDANRWNYSICTATLVANGIIFNWSQSNSASLFKSAIAVLAVIVLSGMAALYCTLWIAQIRDFKALNNAKFEVLNDMAPRVAFGADAKDSRVSYRPFEREWEKLKAAKSTQRVRKINIVALSSSNIEFLVPQTFRILFFLLPLAAIFWSSGNLLEICAEAVRRLMH